MEERHIPTGGQESERRQAMPAPPSYAPAVLAGEPAPCPLHFAMQQIARAAVSQLVHYAHGEYVPRPDLAHDLERWQRLHSLIATRICPASRGPGASPPDPNRDPDLDSDLDAALALVPEGQFAGLRAMLRRCTARERADACPLEQESVVELYVRP